MQATQVTLECIQDTLVGAMLLFEYDGCMGVFLTWLWKSSDIDAATFPCLSTFGKTFEMELLVLSIAGMVNDIKVMRMHGTAFMI